MGKVKYASVQQHFVRVREILGDVFCVWSPVSPTRRAYRAVLEVSPLNFLLKAEEEQDALVERYRSLLKSLTFSLQLIIRHEYLDLRPYLAQVRTHIPPTIERGDGFVWPELAAGLEDLLQEIGRQCTLIARHCYLIIPAPELVGPTRGWRKKRRRAYHQEVMMRALQELHIRVEMMAQQLAALGLRPRRLIGEELARFYQRCLTPEKALQRPLQRVHLASVGHLPHPVRSSSPTQATPSGANLHGNALQVPSVLAAQPVQSIPAPAPSRHSRRRAREQSAAAQRTLPAPDLLRLADLLAPASIEETRDAVRIEDEWVRGIVVTAFPREVSPGGWLAPLFMHDDILDIIFHLHPQDQAAMMRQLKQRRAAYASTRVFHRHQGRLDDPEMEVAQQDVSRLMSQLASGGERLFEVSLFVLVRAATRPALDERCERVMALLQTVFLDAVAHPTTFEHAQAVRSFLPEGRDELRRTITLDTSSLATTFPFLSNALTMPNGAFLGMTGHGEPVLLDPWDASLENPHAFVGGVTGAGKSYLGKLWLARSLLINGQAGERHSVVDPDGEYTPWLRRWAAASCVSRPAASSI